MMMVMGVEKDYEHDDDGNYIDDYELCTLSLSDGVAVARQRCDIKAA